MRRRAFAKKFICFLCLTALSMGMFCGLSREEEAKAATRTLRVSQAKSLALQNDSKYKKFKNEIILQKLKYDSAVKAVEIKKKSLATFRWKFLLSFHFPEDPTFTDELEFNSKPLTAMSVLNKKKHEKDNRKFAVDESVSNLFVSIYKEQETLAFDYKILAASEKELQKNNARKAAGELVNDSDLETMQSSIDSLKKSIVQLEKNFQNDKQKMSEKIGIDVTVGYTFANPLNDGKLQRMDLEDVQEYAISKDQTVYEAKEDVALAKSNLDLVVRLMRSNYGKDMSNINPYINMVLAGREVDYAAFSLAMNDFIKKVDKPYTGYWKILFWKINKNFRQGDEDGSRYLRDDPYIVVSDCQEYENAKKNLESAKKDLKDNIKDQYETLMNTMSSYKSNVDIEKKSKEELDKVIALNAAGQAEFSEVKDKQTAYQEAQQSMIDSLAEYTSLFNTFDATTCGAASRFVNGASISTDAGQGGISNGSDELADIDPISDAYYYIQMVVEELAFEIGLSIPDDFEITMDSYEVWIDGIKVGEKTPLNKRIKHFTVDYEQTGEMVIVFYNGDAPVESCNINTDNPRGKLVFNNYVPEADKPVVVAEYALNDIDNLGLTEFSLRPREDADIAYYRLVNTEGKPLFGVTEPIESSESFKYLSVLSRDVGSAKIELYNKDKNLIDTVDLLASYEILVMGSKLK